MTRAKSVLVVEDEADLAHGLRHNLEFDGYTVTVAATGDAALHYLALEVPDLVILDWMLPDHSGLEVLQRCRAGHPNYDGPVLMLTARGEEVDKVAALRAGADDYVTKPFGLMEVLARVEALLRRAQPGSSETTQPVGRFTLHRRQRRLCLGEREVELRPKELDLLMALVEAQGAVVSRRQLLRDVWGYGAEVHSRTVDTHIAELRRKLEHNPAQPNLILTVRKAGYRLASQGSERI